LASEEAGKSSRGGRGCQGRRHSPSNKIDCLFFYILAWVFLPWALRRQERAPGAAEEAKAGENYPETR
jgi:hypothetical protein